MKNKEKLKEEIEDIKREFIEKLDFLTKKIDSIDSPIKTKIGRWYSGKLNTQIFCVTGYLHDNKNRPTGYGFSINNESIDWIDGEINGYWEIKDIVEADMNIVKKLLFHEAEKRGFTEGVYHNTYSRGSIEGYEVVGPLSYGFQGRCNIYCERGDGIIFEDGKWADIVPRKDAYRFRGYKVNDSIIDGSVDIGCTSVSLVDLKNLATIMERNKIANITHELIAGEITLVDLNKLIKFIDGN